MHWVFAARAEDVAPGTACMVEVEGKALAVCNTGDGVYTIDNKCTHDNGPLGQGKLDGKAIECPRHGARFDVTTGKVLALPAVRPVKSYPTRVSGDAIEVEVG
ncbi:MAG: non-heme iron oxygenase ferredoxin subunit [Tepidiformaceae bacterium]